MGVIEKFSGATNIAKTFITLIYWTIANKVKFIYSTFTLITI